MTVSKSFGYAYPRTSTSAKNKEVKKMSFLALNA